MVSLELGDRSLSLAGCSSLWCNLITGEETCSYDCPQAYQPTWVFSHILSQEVDGLESFLSLLLPPPYSVLSLFGSFFNKQPQNLSKASNKYTISSLKAQTCLGPHAYFSCDGLLSFPEKSSNLLLSCLFPNNFHLSSILATPRQLLTPSSSSGCHIQLPVSGPELPVCTDH